jgi:hypothetical protein
MNTVSLGFKFGGQLYNFTGIDLILDDVSRTPGLEGMCLSAIFVLGSVLDNQITGTNGPAWLVGDAFLKNVYSVYRSVEIFSVHSPNRRLFKPVPDMRPLRQERCLVQSALVGLVVWTGVSQRTAQRCTRLRHLGRTLTYQPTPVFLVVCSPLPSRTLTIMERLGPAIMARAPHDCS